MGITLKTIWILVRYYNNQESSSQYSESSLRQVMISPVSTFTELKSTIYSWVNIEENNSNIIKLRQYDNSLVPFSALLHGSTKEKPFIIEVVGIHQFCPVKKRMILPSYISILKCKLTDLEKRIITIENSVPKITSIHIKAIEETVNRLSNCVEYIDRRLEELTPVDWKAQINISI